MKPSKDKAAGRILGARGTSAFRQFLLVFTLAFYFNVSTTTYSCSCQVHVTGGPSTCAASCMETGQDQPSTRPKQCTTVETTRRTAESRNKPELLRGFEKDVIEIPGRKDTMVHSTQTRDHDLHNRRPMKILHSAIDSMANSFSQNVNKLKNLTRSVEVNAVASFLEEGKSPLVYNYLPGELQAYGTTGDHDEWSSKPPPPLLAATDWDFFDYDYGSENGERVPNRPLANRLPPPDSQEFPWMVSTSADKESLNTQDLLLQEANWRKWLMTTLTHDQRVELMFRKLGIVCVTCLLWALCCVMLLLLAIIVVPDFVSRHKHLLSTQHKVWCLA
ncbi:unnamed protein product [Amoebophrya sp. A120]|nr:unnamed protein product [Amoebophrya sp. A120]|eukprot:GSA120T00016750001.1